MDKETINILGTEYSINREFANPELDGDVGFYNKVIRVRPLENFLFDESSDMEKINREKEVTRHELIHAFFFESGISEWAEDERLVDFLAIQSPKLFKLFLELNAF